MSKYPSYEKKAKAKITQYGGDIVVTRKGGKVYNPATNTYTDVGITIKGKAVQKSSDLTNINGTSVLVGDVFLMCTLETSKPCIGDKVLWGNETYNIVDAKQLAPDGNTVIYWTLQLRK